MLGCSGIIFIRIRPEQSNAWYRLMMKFDGRGENAFLTVLYSSSITASILLASVRDALTPRHPTPARNVTVPSVEGARKRYPGHEILRRRSHPEAKAEANEVATRRAARLTQVTPR